MPDGRRRLPQSLTALVHHIELNKAGWLQRADRELVLAAVWNANERPLANASLIEEIKALCDITPTVARVEAATRQLQTEGFLDQEPAGAFAISAKGKHLVDQNVEQNAAIEERVRSRLESLLQTHGATIPVGRAWRIFSEDFVLPLVQELGAAVYSVLISEYPEIEYGPRLDSTLASLPEDKREPLRASFQALMAENHPDLRAYVLSNLNACFTIEVQALPTRSIEMIERISRTPKFRVLLDTNVLFSFLDLHDTSGDEIVEALLRLVDEVKDRVQISFYVTPHTIAEAKHRLISEVSFLRYVRFTKNLQKVLLDHESYGFSGIGLRFVRAVREAGDLISADDYFEPYLSNLAAVAKGKGVTLYNEDVRALRTDQRVIDDIHRQIEYERDKSYPHSKPYESWEHDILLWYLCSDNRPNSVESPADADLWIATLDGRLLRYDRFRSKNTLNRCLHPTTLLNLMQLWLPRTEQLERAILDSIRPLLAPQFSHYEQKTTLSILAHLSRYEKLDDLSEDTLVATLSNTVLRGRMAKEQEEEKQAELLANALVDLDRTRVRELERAETARREFAAEARASKRRIEDLERTTSEQETALVEARRQAEGRNEDLAALRTQVEALSTREEKRARTRCRVGFSARWGAGLIALASLPLAARLLSSRPPLSVFMIGGIFLVLAVLVYLWMAERAADRNSYLQDWSLLDTLRGAKKIAWIIFEVVIIALVALWMRHK